MSLIQAIVLGIVQGLTEFLPVSSSGHLIFIPRFLGWEDQGISFDVFIHLATLLAVVVFFRQKILALLKSCAQYKSKTQEDIQNRRLFVLLLVSMIPASLVAFFFNDWIEQNLRAPLVVGTNMIVWGIVLFLAEEYSKRHGQKSTLSAVSVKESLCIGLGQALALFPGTSRSGITFTTGMFSGLNKKTAAEFSFLMSIPIIALAGLADILKMFQEGMGSLQVSTLLAGFIAALFSGLFAIRLLLKMIEKWSLRPFVVYRIVIGILILWIL